MSYPCHYTNLCPHKPHKHAHTYIHTHKHILSLSHKHTHTHTHIHSHLHTHTCWFLWFTGTLHRRNDFYTVQTVCAIALHLNLALTGDCAILLKQKKNTLCMVYKPFGLRGH